MKKLLPALAATLVLGTTSTGFAAEEPLAENSEAPAENSGAVKLSGKVEYTSSHATVAADGLKGSSSNDSYLVQLDALAKFHAYWTANARIEAEGDFGSGKKFDAKLPRAWVEGNYGHFNIRLGKMELLTNEGGLVWDTDFSGIHVDFGNKLKCSWMGGIISTDDLDDGVLRICHCGRSREVCRRESSVRKLSWALWRRRLLYGQER